MWLADWHHRFIQQLDYSLCTAQYGHGAGGSYDVRMEW